MCTHSGCMPTYPFIQHRIIRKNYDLLTLQQTNLVLNDLNGFLKSLTEVNLRKFKLKMNSKSTFTSGANGKYSVIALKITIAIC